LGIEPRTRSYPRAVVSCAGVFHPRRRTDLGPSTTGMTTLMTISSPRPCACCRSYHLPSLQTHTSGKFPQHITTPISHVQHLFHCASHTKRHSDVQYPIPTLQALPWMPHEGHISIPLSKPIFGRLPLTACSTLYHTPSMKNTQV
jgi:hypothetical protein